MTMQAVVEALVDGKKMRRPHWSTGYYIRERYGSVKLESFGGADMHWVPKVEDLAAYDWEEFVHG